ncbi:dna-directed rna polymerases i ii and iii subunit rpabc2 [Holotrichia oblita]|uniref:Dna-directed rna polymerases i ii and iii subunit rpabc2 n=1 Tax=Holotrichia oblita TaxID=644536 RepID=A0ACB9SSQ2_HOLOL|nr:dna-directed rna polymerases i ii and iii subunit rpabc2 [Holotrichia oblita]
MYKDIPSETSKVSFSTFKRLFYTEYNIGFSSPAVDACGTCMNLKNAAKLKQGDEKGKVLTALRIHKVRSNEFYKLASEDIPQSLSFCFDLQQVQPLPKSPIQDAFYLRQISFYAFCCVDMGSKRPTFFTWDETQARRGATEISSAILSYLRSLNFDNCKLLRLFCDGCAGQNKNSYVVHTLTYWLRNEAPPSVLEIILHFPVRGHSFADRVFGRVGKILKKTTVICDPEEYNELYRQVDEVQRLGKEWKLYNVKQLSDVVYSKLVGMKNFKRLRLKRIEKGNQKIVKDIGYQFYRFQSDNDEFHTMLKRGKSENFKLKFFPLGNPITEEKKQNVKTLFGKQFTNEDTKWEELPELQFYKQIIFGGRAEESIAEDEAAVEESEVCDCMEDDCDVHV